MGKSELEHRRFTSHTPDSVEWVVTLPNQRQFPVIGTDHGDELSFHSQQITPGEILSYENSNGKITGLIIDSQVNLNDPAVKLKYYNYYHGNKPWDAFPFEFWGILMAQSRNIPLIAADPYEIVPYLADIVHTELVQYNAADSPDHTGTSRAGLSSRTRTPTTKETPKMNFDINRAQSELELVMLGTIISHGFSMLDQKMSRRSFLKLLGAAGGSYLLSRQQTVNHLKTFIQQFSSLSYASAQELPDVGAADRAVNRVLIQPGQISSDLYQSPEFQTLAEYDTNLKVALDLRNACIAAVATAPLTTVFSPDDAIRVPIVMGTRHLAVEDRYRISKLLQDDEERNKVLSETLTALYYGAQDLAPVGVNIDREKLMRGFITYPKAFLIDHDWNVTTNSIDVPSIRDIVENIH